MTYGDTERRTLHNVITGFNKQAVSMPELALRFLELEGLFTKEDIAQSEKLYYEIIDEHLKGKNVMICQLAIFYVLADLIIQANSQKTSITKNDNNNGYA